MSCWLRLLLGKHTEMRIKWKLLYSGIIVFKCGTVTLHVNTEAEVEKVWRTI